MLFDLGLLQNLVNSSLHNVESKGLLTQRLMKTEKPAPATVAPNVAAAWLPVPRFQKCIEHELQKPWISTRPVSVSDFHGSCFRKHLQGAFPAQKRS